MVTNKTILKQFGGYVCRRCLNDFYNVHLLHSDCEYKSMYPGKCPRCQEMKNIVTGLKFSGFIKLLTK